jgi:hypothetical protein
MINLNNLTKAQISMLDLMWGLDTIEDFEEWRATLSAGSRAMCDTLVLAIGMELAEEMGATDDLTEANEILRKFLL